MDDLEKHSDHSRHPSKSLGHDSAKDHAGHPFKRDHSGHLIKSPELDSANTSGLSPTRSCEHDSRRSVDNDNAKLLKDCASLRAEVLLLKKELRRASRRADYDALTGLPNRAILLDRFTQASALAKRHRQQLALLFLDLDEFKHVNDQLGHDFGDKLLQQVAGRLTTCIRASDTACRYGGDEFVILLSEIAGRAGALTAAKSILENLAAPYDIDGKSINVTVSIGLAVYPDNGVDYDDLLRHSDRSMYRNKVHRNARRTPHLSTLKVFG